jgi:hypothetical protein
MLNTPPPFAFYAARVGFLVCIKLPYYGEMNDEGGEEKSLGKDLPGRMWRREKRLHPQNQPILTWVGAPRAREAMRCEGIKKRVSAQGCANRTTCAGACRLSIIACSPFTPGWGVRSFPTLSGARRSPVCARWKFWQWRLTSCMFLHTCSCTRVLHTCLDNVSCTRVSSKCQ